jgi:hypothetical protein
MGKNRAKNREFFEFALEIIEFCPKYANFASGTGNNREFCGLVPSRRQQST